MIKNKLGKSAKIALTAVIACNGLIGQIAYKENFSSKPKNTEELIKMIKEEELNARKDSSTKHIYWRNGPTQWGTAQSCKLSEGNYLVILDGKRNRPTIRHELYHIYAGHCDNAFAKGGWNGWDKVKDEIAANCYAYYGLRL